MRLPLRAGRVWGSGAWGLGFIGLGFGGSGFRGSGLVCGAEGLALGVEALNRLGAYKGLARTSKKQTYRGHSNSNNNNS